MNNDDSFNDSDEVFSLYSSKKITETFKTQLKKIAANNHISKTRLNTKEETSAKKNEKTKNHEIQSTKNKEEVEITINEPIVLDDISITSVDVDIQSPLEDSIEVISEITPKSVRRSQRLRKKKGQSSREVNQSISINSNITVNKRVTRGKKRSHKKSNGKNIEEITIADSPKLTEPEDDLNPEISVKVIWKSVNIKKFQMRKFQKLSYIFEQLSKEENIPEDKVMLTFNNVRVNRNDTPDSLNLQVYNFLDGGVLSESSNLCQTPNSKSSENGDFVTLKFQDVNKKVVKLNLNKNEKLKVGMIKCSEQLEIPLNKIKFYFDGELLEPSETPDSLGLEKEEVIDIKICE